jgi:ankyrin repeat protein
MMAAMEKQVEMVKFLIGRGANVNARDDNTRRLYIGAQFTGDREAQKRLEESGKLKVRREDGASVLHWAKVGGNKEIIELLKKAGAQEQP